MPSRVPCSPPAGCSLAAAEAATYFVLLACALVSKESEFSVGVDQLTS
jgi:hypothetical protein